MSKWLARGATAGAILGGIENLCVLFTSYNPPLSLLLLNSGMLIGAGTMVGGFVGALQKKSGDAPGAIVPLVSGVTFVWLLDKAIEAAHFRGYPVVFGLLALGLGIWIFFRIAKELSERFPRRSQLELSVALAMLFLSVWLVSGRYLTKEVLGSYISLSALAINALLVLGLGLGYVALDRWVARARPGSPESAGLVCTAILGASVVVVVGIWVWSQSTLPQMNFVAADRALVDGRVGTNVLLVSIDTLRADHLSVYGYSRATTPFLEELARESIVFENAVSPARWTLPAHASLFTGKFPGRHGAQFITKRNPDLPWSSAAPLDSSHETLAELQASNGYRTAAIVGNAAYLHHTLGIAQGFETYDDRHWRTIGFTSVLQSWLKLSPFAFDGLEKSYRSAGAISETAIAWLGSTGREPFFLFVNFMDPHDPYHPPAPYDTRFGVREWFLPNPGDAILMGERGIDPREQRHFEALYDGEIRYVDRELQRLVEELRRIGRYHSTMIVVTSDHGEFFGEHGLWGHGKGPFDEVHRVPLLIKFPQSRPAGRDDAQIGTTDIFPTILQTLELPIPAGIDGAAYPSNERRVVIEQRPNPNLIKRYGDRFARGYLGVYRYPWKLVRYSDGSQSLFNLASDASESDDVLTREEDIVRALEEELNAYVASIESRADEPSFEGINDETRKMLRSLGYLR